MNNMCYAAVAVCMLMFAPNLLAQEPEAASNTAVNAVPAVENNAVVNADQENDQITNDEGYGTDDAEYYDAEGNETMPVNGAAK